jgi:chromosome segregation ATPase
MRLKSKIVNALTTPPSAERNKKDEGHNRSSQLLGMLIDHVLLPQVWIWNQQLNSNVGGQIQVLSSQLKETVVANRTLEGERDEDKLQVLSLRTELGIVKTDVADKAASCGKLTTEIEELKREAGELTAKFDAEGLRHNNLCTEHSESLEKLRAEVADSLANCAEVERTVSSSEGKRVVLTNEIAAQAVLLERMREQVEAGFSLGRELVATKQKMKHLSSQILLAEEEAETNISKTKQTLIRIRAEAVEAADKSVLESTAKAAEFQNQVNAERRRAVEANGVLKTDLSNMSSKHAFQQEELAKKTTELNLCTKRAVEEKEALGRVHREESTDATLTIKGLKNRCDIAEKRAMAGEANLNQCEELARAAKTENDELRMEQRRLQGEVTWLNQEKTTRDEEMNETQNKLVAAERLTRDLKYSLMERNVSVIK